MGVVSHVCVCVLLLAKMPKRQCKKQSAVTVKKFYKPQEVRVMVLEDSDSSESLITADDESADVTETESESETDDVDAPSTSTSVPNSGADQWNKTVDDSLLDPSFSPTDTVGIRNASHLTANSTAVDFLSLFWGDDIWQILVDMTNLRAAQTFLDSPSDYYARKWTDIDVPEMKAFFGVRISMECAVVKRRYEHYFSDKPGFLFSTPGYRRVIQRDRFMSVWKFLHAVNEQDNNVNKTDKVYKVRPVLNHIVEKFQHFYVPSQDMSLDEGMIPAKNRLGIKQYVKSKPIKWGIKTFLLCESSTGYIYNFEVYTGKSDGLFLPELGASGSVVARLSSVIENQNYRLYMDRFYNSPALCTYLKSKGLDACGTIQVNRKGFPKQLIRSKRQMKRGESDFLSRDNVSISVWCDRSPVYFVSTFHDPRQQSTVSRKNKDGTTLQLTCPQLVKDYTRNMGGCDLNDQMSKIYRSRRHYRWPRRLMMKAIFWCMYNAYILEKIIKPAAPRGKRARTFYDFVDDVCMQLVGDFRNPTLTRTSVNSGERRLANGVHHPERPAEATRNNTCIVCREKRRYFARSHPDARNKDNPHKMTKTVFHCSECHVYLCIRQDATCWKDYHTKKEFWR